MASARKIPRWWIVTGLSIVVFAWCIAAARSDTQRFVESLHGAHQGEKFRTALRTLNTGGARLDECTACHSSLGWVSNLVTPMPPLADASCARCHTPDGKALGMVLGDVKDPDSKNNRAGRPAHQGQGPGHSAGLVVSEDGHLRTPLRCAACHDDHQGKGYKAAEFRNEFCAQCHVPASEAAASTAVRRAMLKAHENQGVDGKTEPTRAALMKALADIGTCAGCHSEHGPIEGNDKK